MNNVLLLAARILLSGMFVMSGFAKLVDPSQTAYMITSAGIPAATVLAYLAGIFEVVAGLAVVVGFQTRIATLLLAAFSIFTALVFHSGVINIAGFSPEANGLLTVFNGLMMWKNISIAGGFLALAAAGAGAWSVDGYRGTAKPALA